MGFGKPAVRPGRRPADKLAKGFALDIPAGYGSQKSALPPAAPDYTTRDWVEMVGPTPWSAAGPLAGFRGCGKGLTV